MLREAYRSDAKPAPLLVAVSALHQLAGAGEIGLVAPYATEIPVGQGIAPLVLDVLLRSLGVASIL